MKNITSRKNFLLVKEQKEELITEGFFDFIKKLANKFKGYLNKIKGGKEIKKTLEEYKNKIKNVFNDISNAEQQKQASKTSEVETPTAESALYEEQTEEDTAVRSNTGDSDERMLSKKQLDEKIKIGKKRLEELKINFNKKIEIIKNKYTKNGKLSKKLEIATEIAKLEISDAIWADWQNYFKTIGAQDKIKEAQKNRAKILKSIKDNNNKLVQIMKGEGDLKGVFVKGKTYAYDDGKTKANIKIVEVDNDGTEVTKADILNKNGDVVKTINPDVKFIKTIKDGEDQKRIFKDGGIYNYETEKGESIKIKIKTKDGTKITSANIINDDGEIKGTINPHTNKIGDEVKIETGNRVFKKGEKYWYINKNGDKIKIEILEIGDDGDVTQASASYKEGPKNINPITSNIGKKIVEKK